MTSRRFIWGLMALPLAFAAAPASATSGQGTASAGSYEVAVLGALFNRDAAPQRRQQPDVLLAQASDPRLVSLEEQVRALNGRIEELNFLILQMQEQLRKQQEDNEFRFQELENGGNGGGGDRTQAPRRDSGTATASIPAAPSAPASAPAAPAASGNQGGTAAGAIAGAGGTSGTDLPGVPRNLGSIRFDEKGNLIGGTISQEPVDLLQGTIGQGAGEGAGDTQVAALPSTEDPEELYRNSYEFILSGDYKTAEAGFRSYIERFPDQPRLADANFWLGEALAGQDRHRDAAEVFLAASRDYPDSRKAPDTLLKLGMSLAAMKQGEVACATFREVGSRYPKASDALKERVRQEIAANKC